MDSKTSNLELEVFVLRTASLLTVLYAIVGVAIATICDSMTLIVDALYSVVDVVVSLLAISSFAGFMNRPTRTINTDTPSMSLS